MVSRRFEDVVNKIAVIFEQGPDGQERGLDALSDGHQSLFYFALAAAVFDLEREVVAGTVEGFRDDTLRIPALTLFALEEPAVLSRVEPREVRYSAAAIRRRGLYASVVDRRHQAFF